MKKNDGNELAKSVGDRIRFSPCSPCLEARSHYLKFQNRIRSRSEVYTPKFPWLAWNPAGQRYLRSRKLMTSLLTDPKPCLMVYLGGHVVRHLCGGYFQEKIVMIRSKCRRISMKIMMFEELIL